MAVPSGSETTDTDDEPALWNALRAEGSHRAEGSQAARERLFCHYAGFARSIARKIHNELSRDRFELAELHQLAYAGLLEAMENFDWQRGVSFRTYASHRISGSIRDGLAKATEVNEQIATRQRVRRERLRSLSEGDALRMSAQETMEALVEIATGLALGFMLEDAGLGDHGENSVLHPRTAYDSLAWKETVTHLHAELSALPETEQMVLREHYLHGIAFEQLASVLGLSKGRVSQLHRAALARLRKRMGVRTQFLLER
jgi:RNA polymerase sigma factor for flagellar operon FliA